MGQSSSRDVNVGTRAGQQKAEVFNDAAEVTAAVAYLDGAIGYSTNVQLYLRCDNLPNLDTYSLTDALVVVYLDEDTNNWREVGRTECVANNLSPKFATPIKLLYNFERVQRLRFVVIDLDAGQNPATINPSQCDNVGEVCINLSDIFTADGRYVSRPIEGPRAKRNPPSTLSILGEEVLNANAIVQMRLTARQLDSRTSASRTRAFAEISRAVEGSTGLTWLPVLRTETKSNSLTPAWDTISISTSALCHGDIDNPLKLRVLNYDPQGSHKLIGEVEASLRSFQDSATNAMGLVLVNPATHQKTGELVVSSLVIQPQPSFLDYVAGGVEINFIVAVDFTASNRAPNDPRSLHYLDPIGRYTPYEEAILGVASVLEAYDTDKLFPAYGFGGALPGQPASHFFPLNGNPSNPYCQGVPAILQAYRQALAHYQLSGPTLFAPTVNAVINLASEPSEQLKYYVLLILTDGVIMDMQNTVNSIINASRLPVSIMIVGVGHENFSSMHALDSDNQLLRSGADEAERDIVQFVEFNKFSNNGSLLAAELLRELPTQFLQYTRKRNILPAAPRLTKAAPSFAHRQHTMFMQQPTMQRNGPQVYGNTTY